MPLNQPVREAKERRYRHEQQQCAYALLNQPENCAHFRDLRCGQFPLARRRPREAFLLSLLPSVTRADEAATGQLVHRLVEEAASCDFDVRYAYGWTAHSISIGASISLRHPYHISRTAI